MSAQARKRVRGLTASADLPSPVASTTEGSDAVVLTYSSIDIIAGLVVLGSRVAAAVIDWCLWTRK